MMSLLVEFITKTRGNHVLSHRNEIFLRKKRKFQLKQNTRMVKTSYKIDVNGFGSLLTILIALGPSNKPIAPDCIFAKAHKYSGELNKNCQASLLK